MTLQHRTHTGEIVTGDRLQKALDAVSEDWAEIARAIRREDQYAPHVSEETKDKRLMEGLQQAQDIKKGRSTSFTIWQRVNTKLTGECVALLP